MANTTVALRYLYRDAGNYKNFSTVYFSNPDEISIEEIETSIRECCLDENWFKPTKWSLPDLHNSTYDAELDHEFHEIEEIVLCHERPSDERTIADFIRDIRRRSGASKWL